MQAQKRLGYCETNAFVAEYELVLERDGLWPRFEQTATEVLREPWATARSEELQREFQAAVNTSWMAGRMFFRGRGIDPTEHGAAPSSAIPSATTRILPDLYPHFVATQVTPAGVLQLLAPELAGPSQKFLASELGILDLDAGRFAATCSGVVPTRIADHIAAEGDVGGTALLAHFGRPPYGYTANVVKACVAGLLRAGRIRIQPEGGAEITGFREAGVRDLFEKDLMFRRSNIFPAGDDGIGVPTRNRICRFFEERPGHRIADRENTAIADAVMSHFLPLADKLRSVQGRLNQLPGSPRGPEVFEKRGEALERCIGSGRQTNPAVKLVKKYLDTLQDGVPRLQTCDAELSSWSRSGPEAGSGSSKNVRKSLFAKEIRDSRTANVCMTAYNSNPTISSSR